MRPYLLALICVCALMSGLAGAGSNSDAWRRFKLEHEKVYEPEEEAARFANFLATKQLIERHNADPNATYKMGLNYMADWFREEYQKPNGGKLRQAHGTVRSSEAGKSLGPKLTNYTSFPPHPPPEFDWRKVPNRVSSVKDQGKCKADWAFALVGLIESQEVNRNFKELIPLSAQQLIDCSFGDNCENGGTIPTSMMYITMRSGGIESEADYKFEGKTGKCRLERSKFVLRLDKANDEHVFFSWEDQATQLAWILSHFGPLAVRIDASENFKNYKSGVFKDPTCSSHPDHANYTLLIVGYGTDPKEGDYWILKNSRGVNWGEEGYIRFKRGSNMCGIHNFVTKVVFYTPPE